MSFESPEEEIVEIDGVKYRRVKTRWSEREYFSHEGPGWDSRFHYMEKKGLDPDELDKLSNEPYYILEALE